jgi:hypothetical protein
VSRELRARDQRLLLRLERATGERASLSLESPDRGVAPAPRSAGDEIRSRSLVIRLLETGAALGRPQARRRFRELMGELAELIDRSGDRAWHLRNDSSPAASEPASPVQPPCPPRLNN